MRIHLNLTSNADNVVYDHIPLLVGVIHKWVGFDNPLHGAMSLHSFSWLKGGRRGNGGLDFPNGASFFISAYDEGLIKKPEIIVLNKADALGEELSEDQQKTLADSIGKDVFVMSAVSGEGVDNILNKLAEHVFKEKT